MCCLTTHFLEFGANGWTFQTTCYEVLWIYSWWMLDFHWRFDLGRSSGEIFMFATWPFLFQMLPESFWSKIRMDYVFLCELVEHVDSHMAYLLLVAAFNDVFSICRQCLEIAMYFFPSIGQKRELFSISIPVHCPTH